MKAEYKGQASEETRCDRSDGCDYPRRLQMSTYSIRQRHPVSRSPPARRAGEERTGGMTFVMVCEDQAGEHSGCRGPSATSAHVQLSLARGASPGENCKPRGDIGQIGFQETLELGHWFVVETDIIQIICGHSPLLQTVLDCPGGNAGSCLIRVNRSSWAAATICRQLPTRRRCRDKTRKSRGSHS